MDASNQMVLSYLHKAIKPLNQLRTLEDATVIYRISRAPERRIFYIDVGKKSFEGRRYKTDIEVTNKAMQMLLAPIKEYNERARRNKDRQYRPRMVLTLGNHEERISRAVEGDPKLDGTISLSDLKYEHYGSGGAACRCSST